MLLEIIFWLAVMVILSTYLGYPVLVFLLGNIRNKKPLQADIEPRVSLVIAAYNEADVIEAKIINSLALDYPKEILEIAVVSDGSTDGTDEIVAGFEAQGVRLIRTPDRFGKTKAQNFAVPMLTGEIIIFSDATTTYAPDVIRKLVRNFADAEVGGVEGRLFYTKNPSGHLGAKDFLKNYETAIKISETKLRSGVGDNGACYAIRKSIWRELPESLTSDFAGPLDVARQGKRFVFESEALSWETVTKNWQDEFFRKIRTVRAGVHVTLQSTDLLAPSRGSLFLVLWGRKISRWLAAFLFPVALLISILFANQPLFFLALLLQMTFWSLAICGVVLGSRVDQFQLFSIPRAFLVVNAAAVVGSWQAVSQKNSEIWTPVRK